MPRTFHDESTNRILLRNDGEPKVPFGWNAWLKSLLHSNIIDELAQELRNSHINSLVDTSNNRPAMGKNYAHIRPAAGMVSDSIGPIEEQRRPAINQEGTAINQERPATNQEGPAIHREGPAITQEEPTFNQEGPVINQERPATRATFL